MISNKAILLGIILIAVALGAAPVNAQNWPAGGSMLFKVPFDFVAGDQTLPAGEYFSKFDALHRLVLQGRFESWTTAVLIAFDTDQPARAKTEKGILQFERFGDLYVLSAVRRARARDWNELVKSKRALDQAKLHPERQLATILAQ